MGNKGEKNLKNMLFRINEQDVMAFLERRKKSLEEMSREVKQELKNHDEGSLRVSKSNGCTQFYLQGVGWKSGGKYLSKSKDEKLIQRLCQQEYDLSLKSKLDESLRATGVMMSAIEKCASVDDLTSVYEEQAEARKKYVSPLLLSTDDYAKKWQSEEYERMGGFEPEKAQETNRGEVVRSKSEKIIADLLYQYGIAYKYERPLYLEGMGTVHPDFTILKPGTCEEVVFEHFGMMDDEDYVQMTVSKIKAYERNGFWPGINFLFTFENKESTLNSRLLEKMIRKCVLGEITDC